MWGIAIALAQTAVNIGANGAKLDAQSRIDIEKSRALQRQSYEASLQGEMAVIGAKYQANKLLDRYNEVQANNASITASQGRSFSSGSIAALQRRDKSRLDFDTAWLKESGEFAKRGYDRRAKDLENAAYATLNGAASDMAEKNAQFQNFVSIAGAASEAFSLK